MRIESEIEVIDDYGEFWTGRVLLLPARSPSYDAYVRVDSKEIHVELKQMQGATIRAQSYTWDAFEHVRGDVEGAMILAAIATYYSLW